MLKSDETELPFSKRAQRPRSAGWGSRQEASSQRAASVSSSSLRTCPLCGVHNIDRPVRGADQRRYDHCPRCSLIFADPRHRLSRSDEAAHYGTHQNGIHQRGYVQFLNRIIQPMLPHLEKSMRGLDFGCGPGPTLSLLIEEYGIRCENYDPIFVNVPLNPPYDFVFATECFEHFFSPARELERLSAILKPGGYFGIMTELWTDLDAFGNWYYTRDPTHVCFFHDRTFDFICTHFGFERVWSDDRRSIILQRAIVDGSV